MNYRSKRNKVGLSIYTIAKELGISYEKMLEIDRGERDLAGNQLDKFNEIIDNASEIKLKRQERILEIKQYFISNKHIEDFEKLGYTRPELAEVLHCSLNPINRVFAKKFNELGEDMLERIYDFLNDYTNKKIKKGNIEIKEETKENKETLKEEKVEEKETIETPKSEEKTDKEELFELMKKAEYKAKSDIIGNYETLLAIKNNQIEKLQRQIALYEKLIEKM